MRECFCDYLRYVEKCLGIVFCQWVPFRSDQGNVWSAKNWYQTLFPFLNFVSLTHLGKFFISIENIRFLPSTHKFLFILILSYGVLRVPIVVCCSLCQLLCKSDCCRVIINLNIKLYSAKHRFQRRRLVTYNASATMAIADKLYTKLCTGSHWLVRFPWS